MANFGKIWIYNHDRTCFDGITLNPGSAIGDFGKLWLYNHDHT